MLQHVIVLSHMLHPHSVDHGLPLSAFVLRIYSLQQPARDIWLGTSFSGSLFARSTHVNVREDLCRVFTCR
jgi:hypothetical protein